MVETLLAERVSLDTEAEGGALCQEVGFAETRRDSPRLAGGRQEEEREEREGGELWSTRLAERRRIGVLEGGRRSATRASEKKTRERSAT